MFIYHKRIYFELAATTIVWTWHNLCLNWIRCVLYIYILR